MVLTDGMVIFVNAVQPDIHQFDAVVKCLILDFIQLVAKFYIRQAGTLVECPRFDDLDAQHLHTPQ